MNMIQKRIDIVLHFLKQLSNKNEELAEKLVVPIDIMCNVILEDKENLFGDVGQFDPRGNQSKGNWHMEHVDMDREMLSLVVNNIKKDNKTLRNKLNDAKDELHELKSMSRLEHLWKVFE